MGRPKKQKTPLSKNDSNQLNEETQILTKTKSLFDHINQIREVKNPKYFDILPEKQLYKVLCDLVPHGRRFCKWIKPNKVKFNKELVQLVANKFEVSKDDAYSYCVLFFRTESGINNLIDICKQYGKSEKEIEGLMENE